MTIDDSDVHQVLEFRADTAIVRLLPGGLAILFLGLLLFALYETDDLSLEIVLAIFVLVTAGIGLTALALWRRSHRGRPIFVLSPLGVHYRVPWVKEFLVPWREIQGVDSIDVTSSNGSYRNPGTITFSGVTAILVSKEFYDAYIFIDSLLLRGPGWENNFIPKGSSIQMALHPELVSVEPQFLRQAVETRWRAFHRESSSVPSIPARRARSMPSGVAAGDNPRTMSAWEIIQIIVPLLGIVIVLGKIFGL